MAKWEGLPVGPKTRRIEPRRGSPRGRFLLVLLGLLLVIAFLWYQRTGGEGPQPQATPAPTARPVAAAATPSAVPTSTVAPTARPTAAPAPAVPATPATLVVANTQGQGVFIRRSPSLSDRIKAWPERTVMVLIGEDQETEGTRWRNVRDPDGNQGWVPAEYLAPAPTPTPAATAVRRN